MICQTDLNLKFAGNFSSEFQHGIMYRDNELGITQEIITNKNQYGGFQKSKHFFFIDKDEREFLDLDALIEAYNEKFQFEGENPNHTVKYVKVITKINNK